MACPRSDDWRIIPGSVGVAAFPIGARAGLCTASPTSAPQGSHESSTARQQHVNSKRLFSISVRVRESAEPTNILRQSRGLSPHFGSLPEPNRDYLVLWRGNRPGLVPVRST
jgi:hypothetical protein